MDESHKIDLFSPGTMMFFIVAALTDLCYLGMLGIAIPGVGTAIATFVLAAHYINGLIILVYFWGKMKGWLPRLILLISWILPLPLLMGGLEWAIIASNKIVAFFIETVATQAAIQGVVVATAAFGVGEAVEVAD